MPVGCISGETPTGVLPQLDVGQPQKKEGCPDCVNGYVLIPSAPGLAIITTACTTCGGKEKA